MKDLVHGRGGRAEMGKEQSSAIERELAVGWDGERERRLRPFEHYLQ